MSAPTVQSIKCKDATISVGDIFYRHASPMETFTVKEIIDLRNQYQHEECYRVVMVDEIGAREYSAFVVGRAEDNRNKFVYLEWFLFKNQKDAIDAHIVYIDKKIEKAIKRVRDIESERSKLVSFMHERGLV